MQTVVVTDGKYRASIAAVRTLAGEGYPVVVTQTRKDLAWEPPVFASRYVCEGRWVEGGVDDPAYPDRLLALCKEYGRPILLCTGAKTLHAVARQRERFAEVCDFLIAPAETLDQLNDKEAVHCRCEALGIPVPRQYEGEPETYPVIVKPRCGEKFGLKARERYAVANNREEYAACVAAMKRYDPQPLVQERIPGSGTGASLLLDRDSRLVCAICHRRIREYPASGGPSTCCESIYKPDFIDQAFRLLQSFRFVGMAMVEFKGDRVLEVNPRIWGSFPLTYCAESPFIYRYAQAAAGKVLTYQPQDYRANVRMRFLLNDAVASLNYLRHGQFRHFFQGAADVFRAREALSCRDDPAPMRRYLRDNLFRRRS